MGTRADFYIRNESKEPKMEWLGSIAWDGYECDDVKKATTEEEYRQLLKTFFSERDDVTLPEEGWPWPWSDSRTTDYSYIFENGKVMASCFGYKLYDPMLPETEDDENEEAEAKLPDYFPDMTEFKNVARGKKSGTIVITGNGKGGFSVE